MLFFSWQILQKSHFKKTITFIFMLNQRSSNKKRTNMWYQIASGSLNQRTKVLGFTLQKYGFAPLTRWRRQLQKGVLEQYSKGSKGNINSKWIK